ncbi:MAG: AraC family transcriptional regulator [Polyangiales bacterium]
MKTGLRHHDALREQSVARSVLQGFAAVVERAGASSTDILRRARVEPLRHADATARVSMDRMYEACALALDLTANPALGLYWSAMLDVDAMLPVSHLVMHAKSPRDGLTAFARYHRLITDNRQCTLEESGSTATLRFDAFRGTPQMQRFAAEVRVSVFLRFLHRYRPRVPLIACFEHAAPSYAAEYVRVCGPNVRFAQPLTGIVVERAFLDRALDQRDGEVHDALQMLAEQRLARLDREVTHAERVRDVLVRQRSVQRMDMATTASALGTSARSLRRRLSAEGKSYQSVVDDALATVSKHMLVRERRSIDETSHALGFSDPRSFYRAFKRWTGSTPRAYRESLGARAGE